MYLFKYLHLIFVFAAVAASAGPELVLYRVIKSGDVRSIRTIFGAAKLLGMLSAPLFTIGMVFGLIAAYLGQFNLLAPWLIEAYVIFLVIMGIDGAMIVPWQRKVRVAAAASPDDKPSSELTALLNKRTAEYATWANDALIVLIILVMVFKP
ncbi:MAG: DUF2269 family protein [Anaerolineae bacterium]